MTPATTIHDDKQATPASPDSALASAKESDASPPPVDVEFAGWMPVYQRFGYCGNHPQFAHAQVPPEGYRFVRKHELEPPWEAEHKEEKPSLLIRGARLLRRLPGLLARAAVKPALSVVSACRNLLRFGPRRFVSTMTQSYNLFRTLRRAGCPLLASLKFVRSRHFTSQLMLPENPELLFLTSVPYTYSQHPWVVEIEDATTLFFPFFENGKTSATDLKASPYTGAVKALLESDNCRGIITHMRSTAEALPRMFDSDVIRAKVVHVPMGIELPAHYQKHDSDNEPIHLLYSNSWHQNPHSFFLRGGLETLEAFDIINERYPNQVRLTLRTQLPRLADRYCELLEKNWVRLIGRYLPGAEMDALMQSAHIFVIPAARIHIVSMLKAMAYGHVVVASDGWGFDEYIEHGRNGLIVPGRWGKTSWTDAETGMLREQYTGMNKPDMAIVDGLVMAISTLIEDRGRRRQLGLQARRDVAERYALANWNQGLKQFLDRARLP